MQSFAGSLAPTARRKAAGNGKGRGFGRRKERCSVRVYGQQTAEEMEREEAVTFISTSQQWASTPSLETTPKPKEDIINPSDRTSISRFSVFK